jgi:hypothetical protein
VRQKVGAGPYNSTIDPDNYTANIDNPYMPLKPGITYIYEGPTSVGFIHTEFAVTMNTKVIDGVTCVEVHDQVFTDGTLTEDTLDWFAQDKQGNVWYFGEDSDALVNGRVSSIGGSWQGGVSGASPGMVMKAHPKVGDFYRQEFLLNNAEDTAGVMSLNQTVTVPAGTFHHCLETEFTPRGSATCRPLTQSQATPFRWLRSWATNHKPSKVHCCAWPAIRLRKCAVAAGGTV